MGGLETFNNQFWPDNLYTCKEFVAIEHDLDKCDHLFCAPKALISSRWREALERAMISDSRCCG